MATCSGSIAAALDQHFHVIERPRNRSWWLAGGDADPRDASSFSTARAIISHSPSSSLWWLSPTQSCTVWYSVR